MTFADPHWFWALIALPLLATLFLRAEAKRRAVLGSFVAPRLAAALVRNASRFSRWAFPILALAALALSILAAARPQAGYRIETTPGSGRDILLAIDTSRSMLAQDIAPDRITRAKLAAEDIVTALRGERIGLIAFAGSAFLQAPLTPDHDAVISSIRELDTSIIPRGGSNFAETIRLALQAFGAGEGAHKAIILITDGEELDADGIAAAKEAAKQQVRVFTVGTGTPEGAIIPVREQDGSTAFVKNSAGNVVRSRMNEDHLRAIASTANGSYWRLDQQTSGLGTAIRAAIETMEKGKGEASSRRIPTERYQWPLAAASLLLTLCLLISHRGHVPRTLTALCVAAAILPQPAHAALPALTPDPGISAFEKGDYPKAAKIFQERLKRKPDSPDDAFNAGTTAYKSGNYEEAAKLFAQALGLGSDKYRTAYNLGTTLLQKGLANKEPKSAIRDLQDSIGSLEQSLKAAPGDKRATRNLELAKAEIERLNKLLNPPPTPTPPPQQQDKQQDKDKDQKKDQEKKQDQKQDQQGKGKDQQQQQKPDQGKGEQKDQQQKQEGGQDSKPQEQKKGEDQKQGDKKEDKEGKQGNEGKQDQQKEQQGEGSKPEEKQGDEQQQASGSKPQQQPGQQGDKREQPAQPERQLSGDLKGAEPSQTENATLAEMEEQKPNGEMSIRQARELLDSLQGKEAKVPLFERNQNVPVLKDW